MNPSSSNPPARPVSPCKLASVLILTAAMLLASTMTLKASWLWVLAPVALLMILEQSGRGQRSEIRGQRTESSTLKADVSGWAFYAGLLLVAMAFQVFGLPSTGGRMVAAGGCGSGGCGSAGGCGTGGCGASAGGACSCSSGKTAKTAANTKKSSTSPVPLRPVTTAPPNRNLNVQLPPLPPRAAGSSLPGARPVTVPSSASGADRSVRAPLAPQPAAPSPAPVTAPPPAPK